MASLYSTERTALGRSVATEHYFLIKQLPWTVRSVVISCSVHSHCRIDIGVFWLISVTAQPSRTVQNILFPVYPQVSNIVGVWGFDPLKLVAFWGSKCAILWRVFYSNSLELWMFLSNIWNYRGFGHFDTQITDYRFSFYHQMTEADGW